MTKYIFAILITLSGISAVAQEMLTIPSYNPAVAKQSLLKKSSSGQADTLTLPFYDDFSVISVYPSSVRWADRFAFVNTDYAKFPPSIGVATLDALDDKGALYPGAGPNPFNADYLTSVPIRLDSILTPVKKALNRGDSLYLSFYYQPQGRTISPPSSKASLILEFHSPGDSIEDISESGETVMVPKWTQRWSTNGGTPVDSFAMPDHRYFRQVIIPLTSFSDSVLYYKNGFQFRFRNQAALSGNSQSDWRSNGSHWNIDVVYLNSGRTIHDTIMEDVAFADLAPTLLTNYEAMPMRQYAKNFDNEMSDTLSISIANLDNKNRNRTYKYNISKNSLAPFTFYDGGSFTIGPYLTDGYVSYKPWARPPVNVFYPVSAENNIVFHITHTLSPDPNPLYRTNDTIRFTQVFTNYYAYDNGTAEAGIGINGAAGSYAVQFKLNDSDTLRGMQIYFNPIIGGSSEKLIDLHVWNDLNGKPGQIIKTLGGVTPVETDNLNEFNSYWFEEPLVIEPFTFPGLRFYIGWSQTSVENLNVGFDRYKDSHTKRFYNVDGTWQMSDSINYGSLMMRPIVGAVNPLGIDKSVAIELLSIRPNPVSDGNLVIQVPDSWKKNNTGNLDIRIISATGNLVLSKSFENPVDVSHLSSGLYLVILANKNSGLKATGKLIIR
jgi:hypothetical protein